MWTNILGPGEYLAVCISENKVIDMCFSTNLVSGEVLPFGKVGVGTLVFFVSHKIRT